MNSYSIYSAFSDEGYIINALNKAGKKHTDVQVSFLNDFGLEIAKEDIDESGVDVSRSVSGITVSLRVDCDAQELQIILDALGDETGGHFEIE
jgi:hypothetical protein